MTTLNKLNSDYARVLSLMADESTDEQLIKDTMDSIKASMGVKLDSYATIIKELEAQQQKFQAQATAKQQLATTYKKRIYWLKNNMLTSLQLAGKRKIETENFRLSLRKNQAALDIVDESVIPVGYYKEQYVRQDAKIKDDLKAGKEVPGAILKQGESVIIK